jgi:taurine dioxygenase
MNAPLAATRDVASHLTVKPIAGALGAEIHGVNLLEGVSDALLAEIRAIWLKYSVIFFRDQPLPPKDFAAFARRFGDVVHYPFLKGLEEAPEVIAVAKLEHEKVNFGGLWHSDTAYLEIPPMATMLIAREVPAYGGDTIFASGYAAYDALSDGMKRMLEPLYAVNSSTKAEKSRTREDRSPGQERQVLEAEHPVVRTHPETGRKALYVNIGHTLRLVDMTEEESAGLLAYLFDHQSKPEFTARFSWQPGSIALWDNRCALHNPVNDYHGHRRIMHRVTLAGDRPK